MIRGPYFFTQHRTHKSSQVQHCYVWCQWEGQQGTQGLARSASLHGIEGAVRTVKREAERRIGKRIRLSVAQIVGRLGVES